MKILMAALVLLSFESSASSNCSKDAKKHCPGVDPGKGQLAKCLSDYESLLSPACAKELKAYKQKTAKINPCFEDLADLCVDIPAEGPKIEYCLLKNESKLSEVCSKDFKKKKGNILVRNVCAQDVANLCYPAVKESDSAINHCLIKNRDKLSKFCKNNVDKRIARIKKANPCFDDQLKFCPDEVKFIEIQDCLEKKISSLVPACKKVVQNEINKSKANPCYRDLVTHCVPNLKPKQQYECLSLNQEHLSKACVEFRKKEEDKVKKMVTSCEDDRKKFCAKEPNQDGRVLKCLRKNKAKLQKKCSELL